MLYHDHHFQRQRHRERVAELRRDCARPQRHCRPEARPPAAERFRRRVRAVAAVMQRRFRRSAPAFRA